MNKIKIATIAILVSVLGFAGGASAQPSWLPNPGLTPGSPFYFMDTAMENIGSFFTFGKENKVERKLELMSERLSEAKQLANKGSKKAGEAVEEYERELEKTTSQFEGVGATTTQQVAEATSKHLSVLEQVSKKVSKEARKGVQTALQNSTKGHQNALGALQRKSPPQFVEAAINSGENRVKDMMEDLSATGTPEKTEQKVEARMRDVKSLMEEVSSSTQADPKAAEMAAEKMDKLIDRLEQVKEKSKETSSEVRERIDELQEGVVNQHIQSFKTAFENNPKKSAKTFSKVMKERSKRLQQEAAKAEEDAGEKLQEDLFRQQKYENLGKEISEMAKGIRTGTTTVGELVEKATQHHQKVLEKVKEHVPAPAKRAIERAQQRAESRERIQERREKTKEETREGKEKQKGGIREKKEKKEEQREKEQYEEEGESTSPSSQMEEEVPGSELGDEAGAQSTTEKQRSPSCGSVAIRPFSPYTARYTTSPNNDRLCKIGSASEVEYTPMDSYKWTCEKEGTKVDCEAFRGVTSNNNSQTPSIDKVETKASENNTIYAGETAYVLGENLRNWHLEIVMKSESSERGSKASDKYLVPMSSYRVKASSHGAGTIVCEIPSNISSGKYELYVKNIRSNKVSNAIDVTLQGSENDQVNSSQTPSTEKDSMEITCECETHGCKTDTLREGGFFDYAFNFNFKKVNKSENFIVTGFFERLEDPQKEIKILFDQDTKYCTTFPQTKYDDVSCNQDDPTFKLEENLMDYASKLGPIPRGEPYKKVRGTITEIQENKIEVNAQEVLMVFQ